MKRTNRTIFTQSYNIIIQHKSIATMLTANVNENTKKAFISPQCRIFHFPKSIPLKALCIIAAISVFSRHYLHITRIRFFERNKEAQCAFEFAYLFQHQDIRHIFNIFIKGKSIRDLLINRYNIKRNDSLYIRNHSIATTSIVDENAVINLMDQTDCDINLYLLL